MCSSTEADAIPYIRAIGTYSNTAQSVSFWRWPNVRQFAVVHKHASKQLCSDTGTLSLCISGVHKYVVPGMCTFTLRRYARRIDMFTACHKNQTTRNIRKLHSDTREIQLPNRLSVPEDKDGLQCQPASGISDKTPRGPFRLRCTRAVASRASARLSRANLRANQG